MKKYYKKVNKLAFLINHNFWSRPKVTIWHCDCCFNLSLPVSSSVDATLTNHLQCQNNVTLNTFRCYASWIGFLVRINSNGHEWRYLLLPDEQQFNIIYASWIPCGPCGRLKYKWSRNSNGHDRKDTSYCQMNNSPTEYASWIPYGPFNSIQCIFIDIIKRRHSDVQCMIIGLWSSMQPFTVI